MSAVLNENTIKVAVILQAYNEAQTIAATIREFYQYLPEASMRASTPLPILICPPPSAQACELMAAVFAGEAEMAIGNRHSSGQYAAANNHTMHGFGDRRFLKNHPIRTNAAI